ncbi:MAG: penicillin-binding protein 2, partial [Oscillospiraceae bacterium]
FGEDVKIHYTVDAFKQPIISILPEITGDTVSPKGGVVTTLDKDFQQVVSDVAMEKMTSGAVVVMDIHTGELRAVVSMPQFNPNDIATAMEQENSPLFNRAFGAYSVGSTFKLAVAATALKEGINTDFTFFCPGYIEVNGIKFACHKKEGHGLLTMKGAIEQSCNPYFVALGQQLDPQNLLYTVSEMGFGKASKLGENMVTEAGTLYTATELQNKADLANFSFGQGKLTATPIQVAQMISCIANGGNTVLPSLIKGTTSNGETITEAEESFAQNKLLSNEQAKILQDYMINVVENGSGKKGKPENGGAGGKTASAQTGQYIDDREKVEAWFAGFFPANQPKYTVVVFVEGGEYGGDVAGPIFKAIADGINTVEKKRFS